MIFCCSNNVAGTAAEPVSDQTVIVDFFVNNCALNETTAHSYNVRLSVDGTEVAKLYSPNAVKLGGFATGTEVSSNMFFKKY